MRFDKDKIKDSLTIDEIHKIMLELGSEKNLWQNGHPVYRTVCHNASGGSFKLYYYNESKQFKCYTECGDSFDVFELVIRAKKQKGVSFTFSQAIEYIVSITGKRFGFGGSSASKKQTLEEDWAIFDRFKRTPKQNTDLPIFNEKVLNVFIPYHHTEWLREGISHSTMEAFEIGYYFRSHTEGISIPHRDLHGNLVGIRKRSMIKEEIEQGFKYMPLKIENTLYNHPTMLNLYGLHITKSAVKRLKKAVLFESEKSVLKCNDFYGDDNFTCAVCSSNISVYHRDILLSLGVEEVIIALDKFRPQKEDESDEIYAEKLMEYERKIVKLASKFTPYMRVFALWDYNDLLDYRDSPADKGKEILEELMKNKIEITTREE